VDYRGFFGYRGGIGLCDGGKGAHVVLSARRADELQRVAKNCQRYQGTTLVLPFDMIDLTLHAAKVQEVIQTFGTLDYVILNAGVSQRSIVQDTKFEVYRSLFEINFFSIISLTQAILPVFKNKAMGVLCPSPRWRVGLAPLVGPLMALLNMH